MVKQEYKAELKEKIIDLIDKMLLVQESIEYLKNQYGINVIEANAKNGPYIQLRSGIDEVREALGINYEVIPGSNWRKQIKIDHSASGQTVEIFQFGKTSVVYEKANSDGKAALDIHEKPMVAKNGDDDMRCVCCGEIVPEGLQICPNCEAKGRR